MNGDQFLPYKPKSLHSRFFEELQAELIWIVTLVHHALHPGVDQHFRAGIAGLASHVDAGPLARDSDRGRLQKGVLLGMQRAYAVTRPHAAVRPIFVGSIFWAVRETSRRPVVASGENSSVSDEYGTDGPTLTSGSSCHKFGNLHKILVPRRTLVKHVGHGFSCYMVESPTVLNLQ